jgi:hypothetical protein
MTMSETRESIGSLNGHLVYAGDPEEAELHARTGARMNWLQSVCTPEEWAQVEAGRQDR